jgi:translation initiation factor IF-3
MEIVGKIEYIGPDMQVTTSFKKRELAVATDEQFSQSIMIEFTQDKTEYLDGYKEGESVKVSINLRGRKWVNPQGETKYFNSIVGWRIERLNVQGPTQQQPPATKTQQFSPATNLNDDEVDDLPF